MSEEQTTPTESATETPTEVSPPTTNESVAEPTRPSWLNEKFETGRTYKNHMMNLHLNLVKAKKM